MRRGRAGERMARPPGKGWRATNSKMKVPIRVKGAGEAAFTTTSASPYILPSTTIAYTAWETLVKDNVLKW